MKSNILSLLVCFAWILSACTPQSPAQPAGPITITDAVGRSVSLPKVPQRIAIVGRAVFIINHTAYLFPEAASRLVSVGETSQGSVEFLPVIDPKLGEKQRTKVDIGPEQVATINPDLVLIKNTQVERLGKPLEALGIKVVALDLETPEAFARDIKTLGMLFGNEKRAAEINAFYQSRLDKVKNAVDKLPEDKRPRVLVMQYSDRDGAVALSVPPMGWIQSVMAVLAGGRATWKDAASGSGWTKVGFEQIAAWDADQIYIVSYFSPVNDVVKKMKADPQWQSLRAVKNNKIYGFATDFYSWDQPDTRWILGVLWLTNKINPGAVAGLDITAEARAFYQQLYGVDEATFDKTIKPLFTGDLP
jgi:iron complex transport system substrate-binding protein